MCVYIYIYIEREIYENLAVQLPAAAPSGRRLVLNSTGEPRLVPAIIVYIVYIACITYSCIQYMYYTCVTYKMQ